jgi:hypothetical protein
MAVETQAVTSILGRYAASYSPSTLTRDWRLGGTDSEVQMDLMLPNSIIVFCLSSLEIFDIHSYWLMSLSGSQICPVTVPLPLFFLQLHIPTICSLLLIVLWELERLTKIIFRWSESGHPVSWFLLLWNP